MFCTFAKSIIAHAAMTDKQIQQALVIQTKFWNSQNGYEKGQTQQFWNSILKCFDPTIDPSKTVVYEKQIKDPTSGTIKYIDAYIPTTQVLIEQKSSSVPLDRPEPQSDGTALTPFHQAERYDNLLPVDEKARYIVCSNFRTIEIHDRNKPLEPPQIVPFTEAGISANYYRLKFLLDRGSTLTAIETSVSQNAALLIGELYNEILAQYQEAEKTPELLQHLNIFCVRLVFCLYAEDSLVFKRKDMFGNFMKAYNNNRYEFRFHLKYLFQILNTPVHIRDKEELPFNEFPFVNGGLFNQDVPLPRFSESIAFLITQKISLGYDWSPINPAIFGAMFESTLSSKERRDNGMHYTTTENIDKVLAPLFLDDFRHRLSDAIALQELGEKYNALSKLHNDIARIKILDPACGSGNFLTYTYMELRRIENKILYELHLIDNMDSVIMVSLSQFYGFEINDFAVDTAKTALWIAQNQMLHETQQILGKEIPELPLSNITTIKRCNAIIADWEKYIAPSKLDYIVGNPPYVGYSNQSNEQKKDILETFGKDWKNVGTLDYVCCWFKKSFDFIKQNPKIRCAFVSTNSVCQGEHVANFWKPLMDDGLIINYAYRPFQWLSDSVGMAHVHCVIIGFSMVDNDDKRIFNPNNTVENVKTINAYLNDSINYFVKSRNTPISNVSPMVRGNGAYDGGFLIIEEKDYDNFVKEEPSAKKYIKQFVGADEFINNKKRYCLWLADANLQEFAKMPLVAQRIKQVKEFREKSKRQGTVRMADKPYLFVEIKQPDTNYIIIPRVSSEKRRYIPIGFMDKDVISSDSTLIIPGATIYEFGILTSIVHMAWMRAVCGRLKSDYRYSSDIVYNNFPWPAPTTRHCKDAVNRISAAAQKILDIREKYLQQGASLAFLYGENLDLAFTDLRDAHRELDALVLSLYGLDKKATEEQIVTRLFEMYKTIINQQ